MSYLLTIAMLLLLLGIVAALHPEGLWTNFIHFVNFLISALVAMTFWEPVAEWMATNYKFGEYFWDFLGFWAILAGCLAVLRAITDATSKIRVRFAKPIDVIGGDLMALWTAWLVICVLMMSLHMAPLSREFMFGGFVAEERMFFGLAPDRTWLAFVQRLSRGPLARSASESDPEGHVFDPEGRFIPMWASRREAYEATSSFSGHDR